MYQKWRETTGRESQNASNRAWECERDRAELFRKRQGGNMRKRQGSGGNARQRQECEREAARECGKEAVFKKKL